MIPGLGLGAANKLAHTPWTVPNEYAASFQAQSQNLASLTQTQPWVQTHHASDKIPGLAGGHDDVSEDGEVGEDVEFEDVYEPSESYQQAAPMGQKERQISTAAAARAPDDASQQLSNERDGSYSPHLSPGELVQSDNALPNNSEMSIFETENQRSPHQFRHDNLGGIQEPATGLLEENQSSRSRLEDAKTQAKGAILHLWPLDVRFHNFLAEGIDKTLLKSLFQDLGLNIDEPSQTHQAVNAATSVMDAEKSEPSAPSAKTTDVKPPQECAPAAKDKSEERKDRIARLLAAKGSKQNAPTAAATQLQDSVSLAAGQNEPQTGTQAQIGTRAPQTKIGTETQTQIETQALQTPIGTETQMQIETQATKSAKSLMSQVEKSKLIQQKLAALKKAREIPQRPRAVQIKSSDSAQNSSSEAPRAVSAAGLLESIPGLSLSPIKRSSESSEANAEQRSTLQAAVSQQADFATAFSQNQTSRPFLIDVSEEEEDEDEEMEIDSPVRAQTSPSMIGTPARHDVLLDDSFALSETALSRQAQSPGLVSMPLRSGSGMKRGDLESMNKKIEEMKQKIAEAEARKRAKSSRQNSPALSQRHDSSLEDNCDAASRQMASAKPPYGDLCSASKPGRSPNRRRRSRTRVASERLPLLEARRREQLEKLKELQSEVARIEMELEKDRLEQERLEQERLEEELTCSHSDKDEAHLPMGEKALTAEASQTPHVSDKTDAVKKSAVPETTDDGQQMGHVEEKQQSQSPCELPVADAPCSNVLATIANNENSLVVPNLTIGGLTTTSLGESENTASHGSTSSNMDTSQSDGAPPPAIMQDDDEDIAMEDTGYSADEDVEEDSEDDYEPPGVTQSSLAADDEPVLPGKPSMSSPAQGDGGLPAVDKAMSGVVSPLATSDGHPNSTLGQRSVSGEATLPSTSSTSFVPYETPLQYFHAYRFHPLFNQSVAGGLRSLTYSNKIDVKKELCPDELVGQGCPRGRDCGYQHFETIQAPDDQILLQLGAAEHYDAQQRDNYISGLKQLLTDYRNRKVRDFQVISQGIVDYRARFLGDKTKILPLGHITL
ncbi:hypothetical protein E4U42_003553 [Claviceps africana]|uniref:C3H1-type domain-containing protein n=1 Tax=Claviceps africana TaxID=83212 RepID=A0A8K0J918_9HYPO|nr:hypothetical protein E4U42_003553 [Claviceps africana]